MVRLPYENSMLCTAVLKVCLWKCFFFVCRYVAAAKALQAAFNVTQRDIIYTALPLYHTSSCFLMVGQMILSGCTLVVRKKFSASKFFEDCAKHDVTVSTRFSTSRVCEDCSSMLCLGL